MIPVAVYFCAAVLLVGCAAVAPPELVEDSTGETKHIGIVSKVEKKTLRAGTKLNPGQAGGVYAAGGILGVVIAEAITDAANSTAYYVHEITTEDSQKVTQTSSYQFPEGTCVAVRPDARYDARLVRSQRCKKA